MMSHYGHHYRTIVKESPAEHSTATCNDISKKPESLLPEYTSSGTQPPNFAGMPEKPSKMSAGFWTTAAWLSPLFIFAGWKESRTRAGQRWLRPLAAIFNLYSKLFNHFYRVTSTIVCTRCNNLIAPLFGLYFSWEVYEQDINC